MSCQCLKMGFCSSVEGFPVCDMGRYSVDSRGLWIYVSSGVAVLYFLIVSGALPVWLMWFIMLTSAAAFKDSPHTW